jgi:thioesterase domain-containing protein/acyl carrier protein
MKNVADIYALAPLQQLMLVHALAGRESGALVEQFRCTLQGSLDAGALRGAWEAVVARHPLLRTCFAWEGLKKPVQIVRQRVELPWTEHDWRGTSREDRQRRAAALLEEDRQRGFELTRAPLVRLHLARTDEDSWLLVWTCHHLVLDGWSGGLVLREVFAHYECALSGSSPALPPAGAFADYLAWLARQDAALADSFWRDDLAGCQVPLRVCIELPPHVQLQREPGRDECRLTISMEHTQALVRLAAAQRVSLNTVIQAAWAVLLARYAEQDDVVMGVAVSGRPPHLPGVEATVGPFLNNIPLRIAVAADETLPRLLARLHQRQAEVHPFEYCPLDQIVRAAELPAGRRLFDTLVVFENYPVGDARNAQIGELLIHDIHGTATSHHALALVAIPGQSLSLRLTFDRRRFEKPAVERIVRQLAALLRDMSERPDARIGDLSLLDAALLRELHALEAQADCSGRQRVLDAAGRPAPVGLPGELWTVDTATATEVAAAAWRSNGHCKEAPFDSQANARLRTADVTLRRTGYRASLKDDGSIECLGPIGSPARVGNHGVNPDEVAAVLSLHPLVEALAVVARPDRQGEVRLAAFVVPARRSVTALESGQQGLLLGQLRKFAEERLPEPMVPRAWRAVESLPRDAAGRVDASQLPEPVRPRGEGPNPYVAPRDAQEARLATIWSEVLGVEPVGVTDSFLELGGYSSLAVSLLARLEEEFGRRLPLASLFQEPTVAHLAQLLRREAPAAADISLVPLRARGALAPLFCIHPAGGTVFCYLELAKHLSRDVPLYGLQAQGIDGELPPHDTVAAMADHYVRAIKSAQPSGPYHVCGWSTGGIIAFEVARQFEARGDEVGLVALCDAAIPKPDEAFGEGDIVPLLALLFPGEDAQRWHELRAMSVERQLDDFRQRAELAQLLVAGADSTQSRRIYDVFQANMKAAAEYRPGVFSGRLTLLRAAQQATPMHADPLLGWGSWAAGGIDVYETPGSHLTMFQEPAVRRVAQILDDCLAAAPAR